MSELWDVRHLLGMTMFILDPSEAPMTDYGDPSENAVVTGPAPGDPPQDVSQDPDDDYSGGGDDEDGQ